MNSEQFAHALEEVSRKLYKIALYVILRSDLFIALCPSQFFSSTVN